MAGEVGATGASRRRDDDSREAVAQRLLEAGRALTGSVSPAAVLPGVRAVCAAAGTSPSTFYWCFDDAVAYWRALVRSLAANDPVRRYAVEIRAALAEAAAAIRADPTVAVRTIATLAAMDHQVHATEGRDALRLQFALLGVAGGDDPLSVAVREEYLALYEMIRATHLEGYELLLDAWGRTPREPFDFRSLAIALTGLADGFLLRGLFDPDTDLVTLYEDAVTALLVAGTRRLDDPEDLPSFLDRHLQR